MAEMFGAPEGYRQAEIDVQNRAMNALAMQKTTGEIGMQPAELRTKEAQAGTAEMKLRQAQNMERLMRETDWTPSGGGGQPGSAAEPFYKMADIALRSGDITSARNIMSTATQTTVREANARSAQSRAALADTNLQLKHLGALEGALSGAKDPVSGQLAMDMFSRAFPNSPYAGADYSPELAGKLKDMVVSAKDRIHNDTLAREYDSRDKNRVSMIKHREWMENWDNIQRRAKIQAQVRAGKSGAVDAPKTAETQAAVALIKNQMFPNLTAGAKDDPDYLSTLEQINSGAKDIAARAKAILRENPAIKDYQMALQRALTESIQAGEWQNVAAGGYFKPDKTKFSGGGRTADTAIQIPKGKDLTDIRKKLVPGKFYIDPRTGKPIGQWTGTGFSPVAAPASGGAGDGGGGDEADNEPDDDADEQ